MGRTLSRGAIAAVVAAVALAGCGASGQSQPSASALKTAVAGASQPASPEPPSQTAPAPCTSFDGEVRYLANAGTLPVSVTVPAAPSSPWSGLRDEFEVVDAACGAPGHLWVDAALVAHVYGDSCRWRGSSVEAPTVADVVARLEAQAGHATSAATATMLGPFEATRLDVSIPAELDGQCDNGTSRLWETRGAMHAIVPGTTVRVYVAEVDGVSLVVSAGYLREDGTQELLARIDAMLASLRVDM